MTTQLDLSTVLEPGEQVTDVRRTSFAPDPFVVSDARTFVVEAAPPLDEDTADTLKLLTSELVTNAIIHARTVIDLSVLTTDRHVVVTVHDLDVGHVEVSIGREGGWGLGLVRSLAARSDMTRHPDGGKTAWFCLRRLGQ